MRELIRKTNKQFKEVLHTKFMVLALGPLLALLVIVNAMRDGWEGVGVILLAMVGTVAFVYWIMFVVTLSDRDERGEP